MNAVAAQAWLNLAAAVPDAQARQAAEERQSILTKPPGALGRLESIAIRLAALQGTERPSVERVHISVFAGDHGVASEGVSAFPQAVTAEMVKNFAVGGAAVSVAARSIGAELEVINMGTAHDTGPLPNVKNYALGPGTANFTIAPAMTEAQLALALDAGRDCIERARMTGAQLFIGGEMGIGNTTSASALACLLLSEKPERLAGPGTGLNPDAVAHKAKIIQCALDLHRAETMATGGVLSPLEMLRRVGGFEIAALTGAYLAAGQMGLPVLVDGFISSVAALTAIRHCPGIGEWLLFSHASAEPGHRAIMEAIDAWPLLDLGMRLGEGSGAAVAVPLLRIACVLHNEMATFDEAQVSGAV